MTKPVAGMWTTPTQPSGTPDGLGGFLPAFQECEASGHIKGSLDTYTAWFPFAVAVAAARTTHLDVFNAGTTIVRLLSLRPVLDTATAVTGVGFRWELLRSTTAGTGGTSITPQKVDSGMANLAAGITMRQKPSGGAVAGALLAGFALFGEESTVTQQLGLSLDVLPANYVLRVGEGLKLDQVTNNVAGNFGWLLTFTVEN